MTHSDHHPAPETPRPLHQRKRRIFLGFLGLFILLAWWLFGRGVTQSPEMVDDSTKDPAPTYAPVVYDSQNWGKSAPIASPFKDTKALMALLGSAVHADGEALDIHGKTGQLYRYHGKTEPPLYVVDSADFFEVAWYYAAPTDSEKDKTASLKHAKTAHALTTAILSDDGTKLITAILTPDTAPDDLMEKVADKVALAHCKNYLCQIVFKKPS